MIFNWWPFRFYRGDSPELKKEEEDFNKKADERKEKAKKVVDESNEKMKKALEENKSVFRSTWDITMASPLNPILKNIEYLKLVNKESLDENSRLRELYFRRSMDTFNYQTWKDDFSLLYFNSPLDSLHDIQSLYFDLTDDKISSKLEKLRTENQDKTLWPDIYDPLINRIPTYLNNPFGIPRLSYSAAINEDMNRDHKDRVVLSSKVEDYIRNLNISGNKNILYGSGSHILIIKAAFTQNDFDTMVNNTSLKTLKAAYDKSDDSDKIDNEYTRIKAIFEKSRALQFEHTMDGGIFLSIFSWLDLELGASVKDPLTDDSKISYYVTPTLRGRPWDGPVLLDFSCRMSGGMRKVHSKENSMENLTVSGVADYEDSYDEMSVESFTNIFTQNYTNISVQTITNTSTDTNTSVSTTNTPVSVSVNSASGLSYSTVVTGSADFSFIRPADGRQVRVRYTKNGSLVGEPVIPGTTYSFSDPAGVVGDTYTLEFQTESFFFNDDGSKDTSQTVWASFSTYYLAIGSDSFNDGFLLDSAYSANNPSSADVNDTQEVITTTTTITTNFTPISSTNFSYSTITNTSETITTNTVTKKININVPVEYEEEITEKWFDLNPQLHVIYFQKFPYKMINYVDLSVDGKLSFLNYKREVTYNKEATYDLAYAQLVRQLGEGNVDRDKINIEFDKDTSYSTKTRSPLALGITLADVFRWTGSYDNIVGFPFVKGVFGLKSVQDIGSLGKMKVKQDKYGLGTGFSMLTFPDGFFRGLSLSVDFVEYVMKDIYNLNYSIDSRYQLGNTPSTVRGRLSYNEKGKFAKAKAGIGVFIANTVQIDLNYTIQRYYNVTDNKFQDSHYFTLSFQIALKYYSASEEEKKEKAELEKNK